MCLLGYPEIYYFPLNPSIFLWRNCGWPLISKNHGYGPHVLAIGKICKEHVLEMIYSPLCATLVTLDVIFITRREFGSPHQTNVGLKLNVCVAGSLNPTHLRVSDVGWPKGLGFLPLISVLVFNPYLKLSGKLCAPQLVEPLVFVELGHPHA